MFHMHTLQLNLHRDLVQWVSHIWPKSSFHCYASIMLIQSGKTTSAGRSSSRMLTRVSSVCWPEIALIIVPRAFPIFSQCMERRDTRLDYDMFLCFLNRTTPSPFKPLGIIGMDELHSSFFLQVLKAQASQWLYTLDMPQHSRDWAGLLQLMTLPVQYYNAVHAQ